MKKAFKKRLAFLLTFAMVLSLVQTMSIPVKAAEGDVPVFSVELNGAKELAGGNFSYSQAEIKAANNSDLITSLTIMISNGDGSILTVDDAITDRSDSHKIATWVWNEGTTIGKVQTILRSVRFHYASGMEVTVIVDGNKMHLPALSSNITSYILEAPQGSEEVSGSIHYYLYTPYPADAKEIWNNAYNTAKTFYFMGMQGYLVTITEEKENDVLDNITSDGAWAGGAMIPNSIKDSELDGDYFNTDLSLSNPAESTWKWVCGPEAGIDINIAGSVAADTYHIGGASTGFQKWRRPDADLGNQEPNYYTDSESGSNGEWWLQVHFPDESKGWNDLNDITMEMDDGGEYLSGYFVEFSEYPGGKAEGYSLDKKVTVVNEPGHEHTWKITEENKGTLNVFCNENSYNADCTVNGKPKAKKLQVIAENATYTGEAYNGASISGEQDVLEDLLKDYPNEGDEWTVAIKYEGKGDTEYELSENAPVNVGDYNAIIILTSPDGTVYSSKKPFSITKANITVTPKDVTVMQGATIPSTPDDLADIELLGEDKVESVKIEGDTSNLTDSGSLSVTSIVIKNGEQDVTGNYNIEYATGNLKVVPGGHDWNVVSNPETPSELEVYCENGDAETDPDCKYVGSENAAKITVDASDATYTGEPYDESGVTVSKDIIDTINNELPEGVALWTVDVAYEGDNYSKTTTPPTDAGSYNVIITVTDSDGNEYEIMKPFEIKKKDVTITPNEQEVGKGAIVSSNPTDVTAEGLVADDKIDSVVVMGETAVITDTGVLSIKEDSVVIKNGDRDVTGNYNITRTEGKLSVVPAVHDWKAEKDPTNPAVLNVYCDSGDPISDPNCEDLGLEHATQVVVNAEDKEYTGQPYDGVAMEDAILDRINDELPEGTNPWKIDVKYEGREGTDYDTSEVPPTDAGKYNAIVTVTDSNGTEYELIDPFEIKKASITVTPKTQTVGENANVSSTPDDVNVTGTLADDEKIDSVVITGDTKHFTDNGMLTISDVVIKKGEKDVTDNYDIIFENGTLKVVESYHDWKAVQNPEKPEEIDVYCNNGDSVTDPDCENAGIENAGHITSNVPDATYTGQPYDKDAITINDDIIDKINDGLPAGVTPWKVEVTYEGREGTDYTETAIPPTDAGKYNAIISVVDSNGDKTSVQKPFEIVKCEVTIVPKEQTIGKGGMVSSTPDDVTAHDLMPGDVISSVVITGDTSKVADDEKLSIAEDSIVIMRGDKDVTANYDISFIDGELTVVSSNHDWVIKTDDKKPSVFDIYCDNDNAAVDPGCENAGPENAIKMEPEATNQPYTGKPYEGIDVKDDVINSINDELPSDKKWIVEVTYEGRDETDYGASEVPPTDTGKYNAIISVTDSEKNTHDVILPFEILQKELTVTLKEQFVERNETVSSTPDDITVEGLVNGDKVTSVEITGDTSVITKDGVLTADNIVIKNGNDDVTNNYNITVEDGKLVVKADHKWVIEANPEQPEVVEVYCDNNSTSHIPDCTNPGKQNSGSIELVAPDTTYTGQPYVGAGLEGAEILDTINSELEPDEKWTISDITYIGREDTKYPETTTPPTEAGKYNAVVTVADSDNNKVEIVTPFEIEKKTVKVTPKNQSVGIMGSVSSKVSDVLVEGLAAGDTIESVTLDGDTSKETNKGTLVIENIVIKNQNGDDVTESYNLDLKKGTLKVIVAKHDWKAELNPDDTSVLEIYCDNGNPKEDPACENVGKENAATVKLEVPSAIYTGKPYANAEVKGIDIIDRINANLPDDKKWTVSDISYEGREGTIYPKSDVAPTNVGKYNAILEITDSDGNKYTINKPFIIDQKCIIIIPLNQEITEGGKISSTVKDLIVDGLVDGDTISSVVIIPTNNDSSLVVENVTIKNGDKDVTANYSVISLNGNLTKKKVPESKPVATQTITMDKEGENEQLKLDTPDKNADIIWKSSDERVAKVDPNGKVTAVSDGTATITATDKDGNVKGKYIIVVSIPKKNPEIPKPTVAEVYENETAMNAGLKVMQTKQQINVKWGKVPGANLYEIYVQYCGKNFKTKPTKTVNSEVTTSVKVTKINGKKLNLKKNYKIYIVAYKVSGTQKVRLGESIRAHIVGVKNTKQTNVKAVKVKKSKFTLKVGKKAQIKAWTVLVDKKKHQLSNAHAKALRYRTDNEKVAKVSTKGKITAVGKGTCTIYVYARNGYAKKVKVTVK